MSWLSAAWTRNKGAIAGIVGSVPVVGGVLSAGVNAIKTGDYKGVPVPAGDANLRAEADRIAEYRRQQAEQDRAFASNEIARIGYGATTKAAAAVGPDGNIYQSTLALGASNPLYLAGGAIVVLLLLFLLFSKRGK